MTILSNHINGLTKKLSIDTTPQIAVQQFEVFISKEF